MEPQRAQRNTLYIQKEFPHKEITEKIISCANVEMLKQGIKRLIL